MQCYEKVQKANQTRNQLEEKNALGKQGRPYFMLDINLHHRTKPRQLQYDNEFFQRDV
jgi:hypothetical protein